MIMNQFRLNRMLFFFCTSLLLCFSAPTAQALDFPDPTDELIEELALKNHLERTPRVLVHQLPQRNEVLITKGAEFKSKQPNQQESEFVFVFLHGWRTNYMEFIDLISHLAHRGHLIRAYNLRGHGLGAETRDPNWGSRSHIENRSAMTSFSPTAMVIEDAKSINHDLEELRRHGKKVILVGHSMGGMTAGRANALRVIPAAGVILIGAPVHFRSRSFLQSVIDKNFYIARKLFEQVWGIDPLRLIPHRVGLGIHLDRHSSERMVRLVRQAIAFDPTILGLSQTEADTTRAFLDMMAEETMKWMDIPLNAPGLWIQAEKFEVPGVAADAAARGAAHGHRVVTVAKANHVTIVAEPHVSSYLSQIDNFVKQLSAGNRETCADIASAQ
jgi:pimeloyl-ACP methyl ester carboxylesterase